MPSADGGEGAEVSLLREPDRLRQIEDEWRELAVARGNAFITPEWFHAWWRHYGEGHEPLVGVVRDGDGRILGLLPLVVGAGGRWRTARFAGSGLGDHFHPVASPGRESEVATAVAGALTATGPSRTAFVFENVGAEAAWWGAFADAVERARSPLIDRRTPLPYVELAGRDWDAYLASRSRNLRSQVRRRLRSLERDHEEVRVRWTDAGDMVEADMTTMFRLHDLRWAARPGASSLDGERVRAFLADFAAATHRRGWLRLCFLEVDGEAVAAWYGWRLGPRFAYYQAGFDPAWADRSVGFVLFAETIRSAIDEGAAVYDMLLGGEDFKVRFADSSRSVCTVVATPRLHPLGLLAGPERAMRRFSRRLPDSFRDRAKRRVRPLLARLPMARRR